MAIQKPERPQPDPRPDAIPAPEEPNADALRSARIHSLLADAILIHTAMGRIIQTLTEIAALESHDQY